jgi:two-component system, NarL family, sensor histidine kinase DesK
MTAEAGKVRETGPPSRDVDRGDVDRAPAGSDSCGPAARGSGDHPRSSFGLLDDGAAPAAARYLGALVWLLFILFPLANAIGGHGSILHRGLVIAGAALFVATYVVLVVQNMRRPRGGIALSLFAVLVAIASALTLSQASGWGFLFTYCAACAAFLSPARVRVYAVVVCIVLAAATSTIAGAQSSMVIAVAASSLGIGFLMLVMGDLRIRNAELGAARAELARLAVAEERERFARDLHDLLGHSLWVIALKAELAGRMLPERADAAAGEIATWSRWRARRSARSATRSAATASRPWPTSLPARVWRCRRQA